MKELSDIELAKFVKYRLHDFLENSKQKIIEEVKVRNLTNEDLDNLFDLTINTENETGFICEQCGSSRFYKETDYELVQKSYGSYEVAVESNRCRICGLNPNKNTQKGLINKLKKSLGLYKDTQLKRN
ncbi:MAG: hypothetical protein P8X47_10270 [Ignavibacteriaceae bacterium]